MRKNKPLFIASIIIFIYALLGFVAIPKILKPQLEKAINENITQTATIENIRFNPFLLNFSLHGFKIQDKNVTTLSIDTLYVDFAVFKSIDEQHINFKDIKLVKPYVNIIEYEDKTINLQKLAKASPEKNESTKEEKKDSTITFQIYKTILDEAKIDFTKYSTGEEPFKVSVDKLNYTFYDMGTYKHTLASHTLSILINKHTKLNIKGGLRLAPFKMYGNVELANFKPSEFLKYAKDDINFDISDKTFMDLKFGYKVDMEDGLRAELDHAFLNINNLDIIQNEKSLLSLKHFNLEDFNLNYPQNSIEIDSILLDTLKTTIKKDKNGVLNLSTLVKQKENSNKEEKQTTNTKASKPWSISLKDFDIKKLDASYDDAISKQNIKATNLTLDLQELKLVDKDIFVKEVKVSNEKLSFKDGKNKLQINTKKSDIEVNNISKDTNGILVSNLAFKNPSVYLRDYKNSIKIQNSNISSSLKDLNLIDENIKLKEAKIYASNIRFNDLKNKTDVRVKKINIKASNTIKEKETIKVSKLSIYKPDIYLKDNKASKIVDMRALQLSINNIKKDAKSINIQKVTLKEKAVKFKDLLTKLDAGVKNLNLNIYKIEQKNDHLKILKSSMNRPDISVILGKKDAKVKVDEKEDRKIRPVKRIQKATAKKKFTFDVGPVKIKDAKMYFEDKNLPIPFKSNMTNLQGEFSELNSSSSKPTKLKLEGAVDKYGYTKITGIVDINDVKLLTDTNILFKNLAIKNFSPYSGKFVGRQIDAGKLNLDLKYNIKKSDLKASNSIIISDIKLGKKTDSPDAMDLPLELAIALLEDSEGVIDLELPISGNVDDPKFSVGPIVWKVFTNLITKAITAPFRLLAAAFGIEEDKIKHLDFEFGEHKVIASEKESLDNIAKILTKKPKLAIKITPTYHKKKDLVALQDKKFEVILNKKMKKDAKGDEYRRVLEELYTKQKDAKKLKDIEKKFTKVNKKKEEYLDISAYDEYLRKDLASKEKVSSKELENLALKRVENIKTYLIKTKAIDAHKVAIVKEIKIKNDIKDTWAKFDLDVTVKK